MSEPLLEVRGDTALVAISIRKSWSRPAGSAKKAKRLPSGLQVGTWLLQGFAVSLRSLRPSASTR